MDTLKSSTIFQKMDEWGAAEIPYLFIINYQKTQGVIFKLSDIPDDFKFKIGEEGTKETHRPKLKKAPVDFQAYQEVFNEVTCAIKNGTVNLMNLTFPTEISTDLNLEEIYREARAPYKLLWKNRFVCFSPETFVKIKHRKIFAYPMKGTIDTELPHAEKMLMENPKELKEHHRAVNLLKRDLEKISTEVVVSRFRYLEKIRTSEKDLLQTSSELSGNLPSDYTQHIGAIFEQLLPAGSISGFPKDAALELIQKTEQYDRGFYTGVFGVFDGKNLDSAVMIRFIEQQNGQLVYKSGGGVTEDSEAQNEYEEMLAKVYVPVH